MKTNFKVENMKSPRTGDEVANQMIIWLEDGQYFQSYKTIIAFIPSDHSQKTVLNTEYEYSATTTKYLREFLCEDSIKDIRAKVENGTYLLQNLNEK